VCLKIKILFILLLSVLSVKGQSFIYSYVDPCTQETKFINADMSSPIVIAYYGQVKTFSYSELQDGTFDSWINDVYNKYRNTSPCQGVASTTTTTTSTNTALNVINSVMNLSAVASVASLNVNVGGTTSSGTDNVSTNNNKPNNNKNGNSNRSDVSSGTGSNDLPSIEVGSGNGTGTTPGSTGNNPGSSGSSQGSSSGNSQGGGSSGSSSGSSGGGSGGNSSGGSSSGGSGGQGGKKEDQTSTETSEQKSEEVKTEEQKSQSSASAKSASKAKADVAKPAILVTGDIVGIQKADDGSQDARGTMSFTRVKGDGTSSIGFSADYMLNAKIGNVSAMKSWIGANKKGHKHINVLSDGISSMPKSLTNTTLFIRVNSLKNLTALYGGAATYGKLYNEEFISTIAILGLMYKGKLTKHLDATIIAAGIYSPYSKFYTESLFEAKPIIIPFVNLSYKMTKTFGIGITGGGTYIPNQDVVNYQILMGAKLLL
jgi:hypothetical protein